MVTAVNRGYKFKLDPTRSQADALVQHAGVCRLIYNIALEQRRDFHRQFHRYSGRHISYRTQAAELTQLRAQFDWIKAVTQTAQQQALRDLDLAYQRFFSGVSAYPMPRKKGINDSFRLMGREVSVRRINRSWGVVRLPKIGDVRFRWTRAVPGDLKNATIRLDHSGWHVCFVAEIKIAVTLHVGGAIGIDRGVAEAAAYSDGSFASFPKAKITQLNKKVLRAARILSRRQKGSVRRRLAKTRLAALRAKIARVRKHFNHEEAARLASRFAVVCIENLNTQNMTRSAKGTLENPGSNVRQKAGLNRAILDIGWHQFEKFVSYKVAAAGGDLRKVTAAFTSIKCSNCNCSEKSNRKSQAVYECADCGFRANADTNAAINILRAGTQPSWRARDTASRKRKSHLEGSSLMANPDRQSLPFADGKTLNDQGRLQ